MSAITGYRELSSHEVSVINAIKSAEIDLALVYAHVTADVETDPRWLAIARTHFEEGFSALTRAVARPEGRFF